MRDLKHLIYFEDLLQEANNSLVKQAKAEGKRAIGYTCYFMPEVLLDLEGCFGVRLRAPRCTSPDIATYYMSSRTCHYGRSLLERALEGGYNFLDAQMATETCTVTCRFQEHLQMMDVIQNPDFFCEFTDVPFKKTENSYLHYRKQLQAHVLDKLSEKFGIDTSDAALLHAIEQHNEVCRLINEIGAHRKEENPNITGYEFHVIQLVSECCPQYLVKDMLRETLGEIKTREPDPKPAYRARIVVAGSEVDDPAFTKLLEDCGAYVVADRYCYGSLPGREEIIIRDGESALTAVARHYLSTSECPRFMNKEKQEQRRRYLKQLVNDYHADGVLYLQMKFCEFWSYERVMGVHDMVEKEHIPCIGVEKEYTMASAGQLRTRFQAFVESIEIKKIQGGKQ